MLAVGVFSSVPAGELNMSDVLSEATSLKVFAFSEVQLSRMRSPLLMIVLSAEIVAVGLAGTGSRVTGLSLVGMHDY
jgi:hypothetical protein